MSQVFKETQELARQSWSGRIKEKSEAFKAEGTAPAKTRACCAKGLAFYKECSVHGEELWNIKCRSRQKLTHGGS